MHYFLKVLENHLLFGNNTTDEQFVILRRGRVKPVKNKEQGLLVRSVRVENYGNWTNHVQAPNLAGRYCSMSVIILEGVPQNLSRGGGGGWGGGERNFL